jgi:rhomboid protease GluP
VQGAAGVALFVAAADAVRARSEMALYQLENRPPHPASRPALRPLRAGLDAVLVYSVVLVFIHAAANRGAFGADWLDIGNAQAGLIRAGEWWRAVTALGLHADIEHLLSNLALGGMLGLLLAQLLGPGLAWLAILVCGALGNLAVAFTAPADHAAIGASTAVFAALGLLAALAWRQQAALWRGLRRFRPIAAAVMLLALLGIGGERIDVGGHVAGLAAGFVAGALLYFTRSQLPLGGRAQLAYGGTALALFAAAWLAAFAHG